MESVILCVAAIFTIATSAYGADVIPTEKPDQEILWKSTGGGGWALWGCGGSHVYGLSAKTDAFDMWTWSDGTMKRSPQWTAAPTIATAYAGGYFFSAQQYEEGSPITAEDKEHNRTVKKWPLEKSWYCNRMTPSRNGEFIAAVLSQEGADPSSVHVRIGVIGIKSMDLSWQPDLISQGGYAGITSAVPSDDGARVAITGWDHSILVLDIKSQKRLWKTRPEGEITLEGAAFSPDGKLIYAAGTSGAIYIYETDTGKLAGQMDTRGARTSTIAVSPNGRFVGAGTGPAGLVWVWTTQDRKHVALLNHGETTIRNVLFSPDSKSLATVAGSHIKIWKMPE